MGRCISQGRGSESGRPGGEGTCGTLAGDAKELGGQIHAGPGLKSSGDSGHTLSVEARRQPVESVGEGFSNFLTKTYHKKYILLQKPVHTYTQAHN